MEKHVLVLLVIVGLVFGAALAASADTIKYFKMPDGSTLEVQVPPGKTVTQKEAEESWRAMNGEISGEVKKPMQPDRRKTTEETKLRVGLTAGEKNELARSRAEEQAAIDNAAKLLKAKNPPSSVTYTHHHNNNGIPAPPPQIMRTLTGNILTW